MRALIGYFGLNRALDETIAGIRRNVAAPLAEAGWESVSIGHFNLPETIENPRGGERGLPATRAGIEDLDLTLCWVEPQSADAIVEPLIAASAGGDAIGDPTGSSLVNLLFQLHSLRRLWRLAELVGRDEFDLYVFLRPDLDYLDPMPLAEIHGAIVSGQADLVTPSWHRWGGLNDRFAFCSRRGAEVYVNRMEQVAGFVDEFGALHPEMLLGYTAARAGLALGFTPMRAVRVRADKRRREENFAL